MDAIFEKLATYLSCLGLNGSRTTCNGSSLLAGYWKLCLQPWPSPRVFVLCSLQGRTHTNVIHHVSRAFYLTGQLQMCKKYCSFLRKFAVANQEVNKHPRCISVAHRALKQQLKRHIRWTCFRKCKRGSSFFWCINGHTPVKPLPFLPLSSK